MVLDTRVRAKKGSVSQPFFGGGRALESTFKTRILLVGFGYNETNLESFPKLTARSWAGSGRFRGNEARSDHDFAVSLAIPCVRNMLRERWYSMRRPWAITECPPVRERRRRCWYAAPFRRFARLVSIFGYMAIFERRFSCVGRSWPSL
jgi:hypothetical protein